MAKKVTKNTRAYNQPQKSPGLQLWKASTLWRREIERGLAVLDLTHVQFVLLSTIHMLTRDGDLVPQVEVHRLSGVDVNVTSQVLRGLEERGLVERVHFPDDDRSKYPALTKKGEQILKKATPEVEAIDRAFFKVLKRDGTKQLVAGLRELQD